MRALFEMPNDEARRVLANGATVYVLVNPVEYHGPHLSLHNDRLISVGLLNELHARIGDGAPLVAADLEMGVEPTSGPGTRHTPYPVARAHLRETTRALVELGARRLVFMTFHGSALHNLALDAAVREAEALGARAVSPMTVLLHEMIHNEDTSLVAGGLTHIRDEALHKEVLDGVRFDFHAGFFETSLTMLYAPHSVSPVHRTLPACPTPRADVTFQLAAKAAALVGQKALARELSYAAVVRGWTQMRPFYGYTGWPALATVETGRFFADLLLERYARLVPAVLDGKEPCPRPPLQWVEGLTMGGRLGATDLEMHDVFSPAN
jgi:creatinine amidohydrolase